MGIAVTAVLIVGAMSAAVATARPSASPRATVTLRFVASTPTQGLWAPLVASFERANPDIKVEAQYLAGDYSSPLLTQINGGNVPDVFFTNPGNGTPFSVIPFAKSGILMDLAGQPWVKRLQPVVRSLVTRNKQKNVYAWPMDVQASALWINDAAFKRLGLSPPKKFSDLLSLCRKITQAGKIPVTTINVPANFAAGLGTVMAARTDTAASARWQAQRKFGKGKVTFGASKDWKRALSSILDMKNAGCFSPGVASSGLSTAATQLATGEALMFAGTSQILGAVKPLIRDPSQVSFIAVPMPGDVAGKTHVMITPYNALSVSKGTKVKEAALKFVNFMAQPAQGTVFAKLSGNIYTPSVASQKLPAPMTALRPYFKANKLVLNPAQVWSNPSVYPIFGAGVVGLFTGQKTVAAALADTDRAYDQG